MKIKRVNVGIVGSGPNAAIAAEYFSQFNNIRITMLDAGINNKKKFQIKNEGFIPKKSFFGNFFMYKRADNLKFNFKNAEFDTSHAYGGLSNVWGANISYLSETYQKKWGIKKTSFLKAFKFVISKIPHLGITDEIDFLNKYKFSSSHLIKNLNLKQSVLKKLRENNLKFGLSKLAIDKNKCTLCTKCMEGCEPDAIFNSIHLIEDLVKKNKIKYIPNILVDKFYEKSNKVFLNALNIGNNKSVTYEFDLLFVGAGAIDSTIIFDKSLNGPKSYIVKESKKYYKLFFSFGSINSKISETISLSHYFIQHNLNESRIHAQLYPIFFILRFIFKGKLSWMLKLFSFFLKRLYVCMIYLDSEDSGNIKINFNDDYSRCDVISFEKKRSEARLNKFIKTMKKFILDLKLIPLPFVLSSKLGHSQHFGSTMPMMKKAKKFNVDMLGRPFGFKKVSFIDASVIPSIPAEPTTINTMTNAVRICDEMLSNER